MTSDHPIKKFELIRFISHNALAILLFFTFLKVFLPAV